MNYFKKYTKNGKKMCADKIKWQFCNGIDKRLVDAALRISQNDENGVPVYINAGSLENEDYTLSIEEQKIIISSDGAPGAFYALMTLADLLKQGKPLDCGEIYDYPDMKHRGFYHDITRGKIPTLQTLKTIVDTMASFKMNSLQLYVEHVFEFEEYKFCNDKLGFITKDELKELDKYCHDRFIEFIPSLSCFGHLYHLLESDKYKHLSELSNYTPKEHYFVERLAHHTINPLCEESYHIITSLIDQYLPCFTSDKFNICCDETFDLAKDVNKGKDTAELYIGFVKKLISYLKSKNKTVLMWGDIVLNHPETIEQISNDVIFLNWDYSTDPNEENIKLVSEKIDHQIICPGTSTWNQISEQVFSEEQNISKSALYANRYGAEGLLITNWGDWGNLCSFELAHYGLICGALVSWNKDTRFTDEFRKSISLMHYGNENAVSLIAELEDIAKIASWRNLMLNTKTELSASDYSSAIEKCKAVYEKANSLEFSLSDFKDELLSAIDGYALIAKWNAMLNGIEIDCYVDASKWIESYKNKWLSKNKLTELDELISLFNKFEGNK